MCYISACHSISSSLPKHSWVAAGMVGNDLVESERSRDVCAGTAGRAGEGKAPRCRGEELGSMAAIGLGMVQSSPCLFASSRPDKCGSSRAESGALLMTQRREEGKYTLIHTYTLTHTDLQSLPLCSNSNLVHLPLRPLLARMRGK